MADFRELIQSKIDSNNVMVFSKSFCPFCKKVKALLGSLYVKFETLELDLAENGPAIHQTLIEMSGQRTVPNVYIRGHHLGGCDDTFSAHQDGRLMALVSVPSNVTYPESEGEFEYDLIVIGGGSGGIACAKEASKYGKVAVLDYVQPSPIGTKWGLGGTCVNVGCIPKKLMHTGALLGEAVHDARKYGWEFDEKVNHNWETLKENVQNHIGSLNWSYRVQLRDKGVTYQNAYAHFVDRHTIKAVNKRGKEITMTGKNFVLATGMRPRYPDIPGAKEFGISSDDLFSLSYCPGKVVMVGASYVSLECAGFLAGMGLDVTVIVRSILLRGFDQEMAEKIGEHMASHGVKFIRPAVPIKVEKLEDGAPPKLKVFYKKQDSEEISEIECNTVMWAIGRDACTKDLGLENVGVKVNPKDMKVVCDEAERSTVPNIYAIGDILDGKLELTPVAIQAGKLLAIRIFGHGTELCDYINVATTVFTPIEYGSCGLPEEKAIEIYGQDNIEVYHKFYIPIEYSISQRDSSHCYAKIICAKKFNEKILGFHILGPHAGEVTQGFAVAMKCGATKKHFDDTIGIHPTVAELFTSLSATKSSGEDVSVKGCSS